MQEYAGPTGVLSKLFSKVAMEVASKKSMRYVPPTASNFYMFLVAGERETALGQVQIDPASCGVNGLDAKLQGVRDCC